MCDFSITGLTPRDAYQTSVSGKSATFGTLKTNCLRADRINGIRDPALCQTTITPVFFDSLSTFPNGYSFFQLQNYVADDGNAEYNEVEEYLDINSGVGGSGFTKTFGASIPTLLGQLDHVKYLVFRNDLLSPKPDGSELVVESEIAVQTQIGTIPGALLPGVTNPNMDIRLALGALSLSDGMREDGTNPTFIAFDIYFTNESIYAFYERLAIGKPQFGGPGPDYQAFNHAVEIAKRNVEDPLNDFTKVAIAYNRRDGIARFFVDGEEKFRIDRVGYPLDRTFRIYDTAGPAQLTDIPSFRVGFGTVSLLDNINPVVDTSLQMALSTAGNIDANRPLVQLAPDAFFVDPQRVHRATGAPVQVGEVPYPGADDFNFLVTADGTTNTRLFGNGARIRLKYLNVYTQQETCSD
jgi:hypothetical protein